jgi:hypothetical protein
MRAMALPSRRQSSFESCRIQRLSIHRYCRPRRYANDMASRNVRGSCGQGMPTWNRSSVELVVWIRGSRPQQWLRHAYAPISWFVTRSLTCSGPSICRTRVGSGVRELQAQFSCSFTHSWSQWRTLRTASSEPVLLEIGGTGMRYRQGQALSRVTSQSSISPRTRTATHCVRADV